MTIHEGTGEGGTYFAGQWPTVEEATAAGSTGGDLENFRATQPEAIAERATQVVRDVHNALTALMLLTSGNVDATNNALNTLDPDQSRLLTKQLRLSRMVLHSSSNQEDDPMSVRFLCNTLSYLVSEAIELNRAE